MTLARFLVVAVLGCAVCGCQTFKDDPVMGDNPWKPGDRAPMKSMPSRESATVGGKERLD